MRKYHYVGLFFKFWKGYQVLVFQVSLIHHADKNIAISPKCIVAIFRKELTLYRSSRPEVLLRKGVLKICSKFIGEHPCRSAISIKLQNNFIEIALRYGSSPVNLLHIFRAGFLKNTSRRLLLFILLQGSFWDVFCFYVLIPKFSSTVNVSSSVLASLFKNTRKWVFISYF